LNKIILIILAIFTLNEAVKTDESDIIIKDESIRLRVIANSNSVYDQNIKKEVKKILQDEISNNLNEVQNISELRIKINENLDKYKTLITNLFDEYNYEKEININFGYNYFPEKEYQGTTYEEGEYESLVITIGEGAGDNWWCVLFPPLCIAEAEENTNIEYKFKVTEIISSIFG